MLFVYYKDVQLHVLILCTPPPPTPPYVTCCRVMLCAPTHFEHGTPIMLSLLSVCVRKFSYFSFFVGGSSYDFVKVFYFIPSPFPSSSRNYVQGMLPTLPLFPKTTCFLKKSQFMHPHTEIYTHPPASLPPSAIHTVHIQKPSHPLIQKTHTPTNPSQFLQISNWADSPAKSSSDTSAALRSGPLFLRTHTISATFSPQHMKRTKTRRDNLTSEASRLSTCDPERLVELQTQKSKHIPAA